MKTIQVIAIRPKNQPDIKKNNLNWALFPAYIGLIATSFSVYYTSQTVRQNEKWRKGEFIAMQFEKFNNDSSVQFVTGFLDYFNRLVTLNSTEITNLELDDVSIFLLPLDLSEDVSGLESSIVRNKFDAYLDWLSIFNRYINSELVTKKDLEPYLDYQLKIIGIPSDESGRNAFQEALWSYIDRFGFTDVQQLFCIYGYNIYPASKSNLCTQIRPSELNQKIMEWSKKEQPANDTILFKGE